MRHLHCIQGRYDTTYKGTRQVQDTYKVDKVGMRHLQGVQGGYNVPTRHMMQVQDTYKR